MTRLLVKIDAPPQGELEISGNGTNPTDDQMAEEQRIRQSFLDAVSPYLESLPKRPPHRAGNVSHVELLGRDVWSEMNHYLLTLQVDIGNVDLSELSTHLPPGSEVSVVGGDYQSISEWSSPSDGEGSAPS
jgi:hypothetical protein